MPLTRCGCHNLYLTMKSLLVDICYFVIRSILLAVASHLSTCLLPSPTELEVLSIQLLLSSPIIIYVVYIPPTTNKSYWISLLQFLESIFASDFYTIVVGDFNSPNINWPLLSATVWSSTFLCELIFKMQLSQIVDCPTHIKGIFWILWLLIPWMIFLILESTNIKFFPLVILLFHAQVMFHNILKYLKADYIGMCHFLTDWDFSKCFISSDAEWYGLLLREPSWLPSNTLFLQ